MNEDDQKYLEKMMAEYWIHVQHYIDPKYYGVPHEDFVAWHNMSQEMR